MAVLVSKPLSASGTAKVRCRMPLLLRKSVLFHRPDRAEVAMVELIWTTPRFWGRMLPSADPAWCVVRIGPFVLAVRFTL
jgi:hypothetical protein